MFVRRLLLPRACTRAAVIAATRICFRSQSTSSPAGDVPPTSTPASSNATAVPPSVTATTQSQSAPEPRGASNELTALDIAMKVNKLKTVCTKLVREVIVRESKRPHGKS